MIRFFDLLTTYAHQLRTSLSCNCIFSVFFNEISIQASEREEKRKKRREVWKMRLKRTKRAVIGILGLTLNGRSWKKMPSIYFCHLAHKIAGCRWLFFRSVLRSGAAFTTWRLAPASLLSWWRTSGSKDFIQVASSGNTIVVTLEPFSSTRSARVNAFSKFVTRVRRRESSSSRALLLPRAGRSFVSVSTCVSLIDSH